MPLSIAIAPRISARSLRQQDRVGPPADVALPGAIEAAHSQQQGPEAGIGMVVAAHLGLGQRPVEVRLGGREESGQPGVQSLLEQVPGEVEVTFRRSR